jgi:hypothetical protein
MAKADYQPEDKDPHRADNINAPFQRGKHCFHKKIELIGYHPSFHARE